MGDCGEAYFGAERGEEDVFVDEEHINCQLHILVKLDQLGGHLNNALCHPGCILSYRISFHF